MLTSSISLLVHPRTVLILVAAVAAVITAMLVVDGVVGAGSPTNLHYSSFSSAAGTMSSGSYQVVAELAPVGFVGKASSMNYSIEMGMGSIGAGKKSDLLSPFPPPVPVPAMSLWGLIMMAAALFIVTAISLKRRSHNKPRAEA